MITLEIIKEAMASITQGEWKPKGGLNVETHGGEHICACGRSGYSIEKSRANAQFIASAPAYIKWLIDRVERLDSENEKLLKELRREDTRYNDHNDKLHGLVDKLEADLEKYKERVEELEKCVELANQRAELTNEIMTGATANVNEIRTLKADLAKYKKLEDAAREVYNAYIEATPHDTDFDWGSWGNKMDKALKEIGEARGRGVDRNELNGLQNEKLQAATSAMCGENYFLKEKNEKLKKVAERLEKDYEHAKKLYGEQQGLYQDTFQEFEKFKAMQTVIKTYK